MNGWLTSVGATDLVASCGYVAEAGRELFLGIQIHDFAFGASPYARQVHADTEHTVAVNRSIPRELRTAVPTRNSVPLWHLRL